MHFCPLRGGDLLVDDLAHPVVDEPAVRSFQEHQVQLNGVAEQAHHLVHGLVENERQPMDIGAVPQTGEVLQHDSRLGTHPIEPLSIRSSTFCVCVSARIPSSAQCQRWSGRLQRRCPSSTSARMN